MSRPGAANDTTSCVMIEKKATDLRAVCGEEGRRAVGSGANTNQPAAFLAPLSQAAPAGQAPGRAPPAAAANSWLAAHMYIWASCSVSRFCCRKSVPTAKPMITHCPLQGRKEEGAAGQLRRSAGAGWRPPPAQPTQPTEHSRARPIFFCFCAILVLSCGWR